ncbi:MAG: hypothetical protein HYY37_06920 [Candidatus Aenigmarchaeota archaeon]|nr:hypothetical protein [Candidatus Aenigmarchaeota archaeon]
MADTDGLTEELYRAAGDARKEAAAEGPDFARFMGLYHDNDGTPNLKHVPVYVDALDDPHTLGVTEITYNGIKDTMQAAVVGLNTSIGKLKGYFGRAKRVAKHEFDHVLSAALATYDDMRNHWSNQLMESIPTYARAQFERSRGNHELATTILEEENPYPLARAIGEVADREYVGPDGSRGYHALIGDVQREASMYGPLKRLLRKAGEKITTLANKYAAQRSALPAAA